MALKECQLINEDLLLRYFVAAFELHTLLEYEIKIYYTLSVRINPNISP